MGGAIDLDPASHAEANRTVKATRFFTEQDNGLAMTWFGAVFINPPGGLVNEFWTKLMTEWRQCRIEQAIWVGYSLEQLQTLQMSNETFHPLDFPMCIPRKRIAFVENKAMQEKRVAKLLAKGKKPNLKSSPSHSNYITYLGPNTFLFKREFGLFGAIGGC